MEKNIALTLTLPVIGLAISGLRKAGIARLTFTATLLSSLAFANPAMASGLEIFIDVEIDAAGDLQLYEDGEQISGPLVYESGGDPITYVFYDIEDGTDTWEIDLVSSDPATSVTCVRTQAALECEHDGSTDTELSIEATSQQTSTTKRRPILIEPPPETQPS